MNMHSSFLFYKTSESFLETVDAVSESVGKVFQLSEMVSRFSNTSLRFSFLQNLVKRLL